MKASIYSALLLSMLTFNIFAGDLDGFWRSTDQRRNIEIIYTTNGIKARSAGQYGSNDWINYDRFENNRYRDARGNCFSLSGNTLEWCTADRRELINYTHYSNNAYGNSNSNRDHGGYSDHDRQRNDQGNDRNWNDRDRNRDRNNGDSWNGRDRDSWNSYYKSYEGNWHNHTTGQRISVDLTRRSLRIKFRGERWIEVSERNRGLFVDQLGNQFIFNTNYIEFRSNDGDLSMRLYNDDRCVHHDDYRSEYYR